MDSEFKTGSDVFQCTQCGACCKGYGGTYVTEADITKISAYINCPEKIFVEKYCTKSGKRLILKQGPDESCIFFDANCTIHPVKPYMCRAWPFIKAVVAQPENWEAMGNSCPGIKKNVPETILKKIVSMEIEKLNRPVNA
ncbi:MAG: YkgJ family cysteine cluster protein [Desulfobacteraceae bacterium]